MALGQLYLIIVYISLAQICLIFCQESVATYSLEGKQKVPPVNPDAGFSNNRTDASKIRCWRCNRYQGRGEPCPETQSNWDQSIEADNPNFPEMYLDRYVQKCAVCMKITTTSFHRNRNYIAVTLRPQSGKHFESRDVVTRVCIEEKTDARQTSGCITDESLGGRVERCYCTEDLCNHSNKLVSSLYILTSLTLALLAFLL